MVQTRVRKKLVGSEETMFNLANINAKVMAEMPSVHAHKGAFEV